MLRAFFTAILCLCAHSLFPQAAVAQNPPASPSSALVAGASLTAQDTLNCPAEANPDAATCLSNLVWEPSKFTVTINKPAGQLGDWIIQFPSPKASGDQPSDTVSLEWYLARETNGNPKVAPAVVVIHETGGSMTVGRSLARGFNNNGFHALLLHLPGYGLRKSPYASDMKNALTLLKQAVSDVRRARDAVFVLPYIDQSNIAVQGTSLGGFIVATSAGLDNGYDKVLLLLAGGGISSVLHDGARAAAALRKRLMEAGFTSEDIKSKMDEVEPLRLAHRIDPQKTWLLSGRFDDVVPPESSLALKKAARLSDDHCTILPVGHYTSAFAYPVIIKEMVRAIRKR